MTLAETQSEESNADQAERRGFWHAINNHFRYICIIELDGQPPTFPLLPLAQV